MERVPSRLLVQFRSVLMVAGFYRFFALCRSADIAIIYGMCMLFTYGCIPVPSDMESKGVNKCTLVDGSAGFYGDQSDSLGVISPENSQTRSLMFAANRRWRNAFSRDLLFLRMKASISPVQCADVKYLSMIQGYLDESFFEPISSIAANRSRPTPYKDGWNRAITVEMEDKFCISIRSSGLDQKRYTSDDIIYLIRGEFEHTELLLDCIGDGSPPADCSSVDGITDGWNRPFQCRPEPGAIELRSSGFDGVFGTQDDPFKTIRTQPSNSAVVP